MRIRVGKNDQKDARNTQFGQERELFKVTDKEMTIEKAECFVLRQVEGSSGHCRNY